MVSAIFYVPWKNGGPDLYLTGATELPEEGVGYSALEKIFPITVVARVRVYATQEYIDLMKQDSKFTWTE